VPTDDSKNEDFDDIARELRELRARAGGPSYAEIGSRIAQARQQRGVPTTASLPARTTVYDAFRTGRSRVNAALVGEIARALGADESAAAAWEARCGRAQSARRTAAGKPAPAQKTDARHTETTLAEAPLRDPQATRAVASAAARHRGWWVALLLIGCVALNVSGHAAVSALTLPLFLDMVGTAVAALAIGPWSAVMVAVASTLAVSLADTADALPFGLVNVAGALVWGYGVRVLSVGRPLPRFLALNLVAGVVCTVIAVPILMTMFGGDLGHASDDIADGLLASGEELAPAVFTANLLTSLADKLLTGFIALAVIGLLPARLVGIDRMGSIIGRVTAEGPRRAADTRTDAALPV